MSSTGATVSAVWRTEPRSALIDRLWGVLYPLYHRATLYTALGLGFVAAAPSVFYAPLWTAILAPVVGVALGFGLDGSFARNVRRRNPDVTRYQLRWRLVTASIIAACTPVVVIAGWWLPAVSSGLLAYGLGLLLLANDHPFRPE